MNNIISMLPEILKAIEQTIIMVLISISAAVIFGGPLGILLYLTSENNLHESRTLNRIMNYLVNLIRSFPFIILLLSLIPLTRLVTGTTIGPIAASVSLSVAAIPFFGRLVEQSLREVPRGIIEAAISTGANTWFIIRRVLLTEARPSLVSGLTVTIVSFISYSAMAGAVGGGGVGDLAIRYGYYRFQTDIMVACIVLLLILVQLVQSVGTSLASRLDKRN
ncbi:methionine ABC transporter permease [Paenibacillus roseipurpureus]|uniref:Methionine ABC transporter permease n=1 Tax=Paenibacillus roseopurpureus TaxID=2918901 RepID=A0AA96LRN2_9BACL|nr:methionine ABC transporter permease [Paenibacillus sp. MBLB1832]WNR46800.1 methionine ABC transporter permease [Paenibacillus sp. MBLB1832]